eukprot:352360-Chlamydomonas_euryale.AAC.1
MIDRPPAKRWAIRQSTITPVATHILIGMPSKGPCPSRTCGPTDTTRQGHVLARDCSTAEFVGKKEGATFWGV